MRTPEEQFDIWFEEERGSSVDFEIESDCDEVNEDNYNDIDEGIFA